MDSAQAKLIDGVGKALAPRFDGLSLELAAIQSAGGETHTLLARIDERLQGLERLSMRLDALETIGGKSGGAAGPKRPPRPERKVGPAPPRDAPRGSQAAAPGEEDDGYGKVGNSMQFCRRKFADDPEFRARYLTEEGQQGLDGDPSVAKHPPGSEERFLAEGTTLWKKHLTPEKKAEIKREFNAFKQERTCTQIRDPLGETVLEEAEG